MNTNIFKSAIAALALLVVFNSCKEKEEEFEFPYEEVEILVEDGAVFTDLEELANTHFSKKDVSVFVTTTPQYNATSGSWRVDNTSVEGGFNPYKKYYWYLRAKGKNGEYGYSEIRSFYYVPAPKFDIHNVKGDWAAVVKWEKNDFLLSVQTITLKPNKDCKYDSNPISVPAGQDSCYISAGTLDNQKYQIYHNWWDEAHGKYYEPVIYDFELTMRCVIEGDTVSAPAKQKGIFLNTDGYVADSSFNVYRYEKIGNKIWMIDDIRAELDVKDDWGRTVCKTITLKSGLKMKIYTDYALEYNDIIIPEGFHLASDDDWQDLESHFGIERTNISSYYHGITILSMYLDTTMTWDKDWNLCDIYVGEETNIREYLIFDNEWIDYGDSTKTLTGSHIFNAHPVGAPTYSSRLYVNGDSKKDKGASFLTSTKYENEPIIRLLSNVSRGIGRMVNDKRYNTYEDFYLFRCVKDE